MFACNEKNITISGTGTIYGQGDKVFFDDDTDGGYHESPLNVTSFRPRTTFFENIENLTVRDITIQDAAFWTLHMAGCRHVRISDIRILNDVRGANNDGIDPDCCSDVIITGCIRNITGDHIQMKTENALFIAGELDAVISDVTITDIKLKMCQQGTQVADSFDEQPSLRDVYPHQVPAVYLRNASRIQITGRVELEKPYCVAKNLLVIEEACEDNRVEVVCREIE